MGININDLNNRLNLDSAALLTDRESVLDNLRELSKQELKISGGSNDSSSSVTDSDSDSESFTISIPDFDSSLDSIPFPSFASLRAPVPPRRGVFYSYLDDIDINVSSSSNSTSNSSSH